MRSRVLLKAFSDGRAQGVREGRSESRPFRGDPSVGAPSNALPQHESIVAYEQTLLRAIPELHLRIRDAQAALDRFNSNCDGTDTRMIDGTRKQRRLAEQSERRRQGLIERATLASDRLEWCYSELTEVRLWLDAFVESAKAYTAVRGRYRRTPLPEPPPPNITIYHSAEKFVQENPRRLARRFSDGGAVLDGADFGYRWTWIEFDHPWVVTTWRISYIEKLGEVYAEMQHPSDSSRFGWESAQRPINRPVWLFNTRIPIDIGPALPHWFPRTTWEWLVDRERELQEGQNSLLAFAQAFEAEYGNSEEPSPPSNVEAAED